LGSVAAAGDISVDLGNVVVEVVPVDSESGFVVVVRSADIIHFTVVVDIATETTALSSKVSTTREPNPILRLG
jgi:hypothetical protein